MKVTSKSENVSKAAQTIIRPKTQLVHLEFHDPAARKVWIAGTFNAWHPEVSEMISMGSGQWMKDLDLAPGTYEYRFVVDGKWMTDPRCAHTVPNPFGETNSLLVVSEPKATRRPATAGKTSRSAAPPR